MDSRGDRIGRVMQLGNPLACWLRDRMLGTRRARRMQMEQLRQLMEPSRVARQPSPDPTTA
jgi:hypothetical protein